MTINGDHYESTCFQASINSNKRRQSITEMAARTDDTVLTQRFSDAVKKILSKAVSLGDSYSFTDFQKIIQLFACILEGQMKDIPGHQLAWNSY